MENMTYYGPKEIAAAFRTVRNNTIKIAEEIPEDQYGFSPAPGTRTIAQTLIHISNLHKFQKALHGDMKLATLEGFDFMAFLGPLIADEQTPYTKAQIVEKLKTSEKEYATWIEGLSETMLGEALTMPPGGNPPSRTRFDMIISVKEHEMHHRGQLMTTQRLIGMVPHLTRAQQERMATMQAQQSKA
jgi:uncharacterized damage-inducible protein DinB